MKHATANLATFLDSDASRAMVMWEDFRFTLSGGRTISLTTRDPDFPLPPAPPPPPDTYLLDTFVGDGNMTTHIGEAGANWPAVNAAELLAPFDLVDGGGVASETEGLDTTLLTTWAPGTIDPTSAFRLGASLAITGAYFYVGSIQDANYSSYATLSAFIDNAANLSGPTVHVQADIYGATSNFSQSFEAGVDPGDAFDMTLEVDADMRTIRVTVNGEGRLEGSLAEGDAMQPQTLTYIRMSTNSGDPPDGTLLTYLYGEHFEEPLEFLFDDFSTPRAGATLADHVGQVGAVWSVQDFFGGSPPSLSNAALLSSHFLCMTGNGPQEQFYSPSGKPPDDLSDFYLQLPVDIFADDPGASMMGIITASGDSVRLNFESNGSASFINARVQPNSGENQVTSGTVVVTGQTTMRLEVTNNRRNFDILYTGGFTLLSAAFNTPLDTIDAVYIGMNNDGGAGSRGIISISGGPLP